MDRAILQSKQARYKALIKLYHSNVVPTDNIWGTLSSWISSTFAFTVFFPGKITPRLDKT